MTAPWLTTTTSSSGAAVRDPIEHGAGAGHDLDQRLAPPGGHQLPVRCRVVAGAVAGGRVGLARRASRSSARGGPPRRRRGSPEHLGEDLGRLPRARERARDDRARARSATAIHARGRADLRRGPRR